MLRCCHRSFPRFVSALVFPPPFSLVSLFSLPPSPRLLVDAYLLPQAVHCLLTACSLPVHNDYGRIAPCPPHRSPIVLVVAPELCNWDRITRALSLSLSHTHTHAHCTFRGKRVIKREAFKIPKHQNTDAEHPHRFDWWSTHTHTHTHTVPV
jgi:hypothetical protein